MRILAATDGSPLGDAALDEIARRPWPEGSELEIVNVIDPWPAMPTESWTLPPAYYEELTAAATRDSERILTAARERVGEPAGLTVSTAVLMGSPTHTILDEAGRWGADLVVVGSHGYGAVKRVLLGSVSHAVALHAPCSVEVVRGQRAQ